MNGFATKTPALRLAVALCSVIGLGASSLQGEPPRAEAEMLEDAELFDICFVDSQKGWAVGDRGVIWHTLDAGRHWELQDSPASCRLESVYFLNDRLGWIAGGWTHPYTHLSSGIVLRTTDGGRHWQIILKGKLPALKKVKFLDDRRGWAFGHPSSIFPSGVYRTSDGGRTWTGLHSKSRSNWNTGDARDMQHAVVAGGQGAIGVAKEAGLEPSHTPPLGPRHLRQLRLTGPRGGWLVGDGGLLMRTIDGGQSWQLPPSLLPGGLAAQFDFRALAVWGDHCWIAGAPGTCVLNSPDGGATWRVLPTSQSSPLRAMAFVDADHGWAVGALGTILATRDGGRTWQRQRAGGTRAAVMIIANEAEDLPLELITALAGQEGYLTVVEVLNKRDFDLPSAEHSPYEQRTHESVSAAGGSAANVAWRFPLRQVGLQPSQAKILQLWNEVNDGDAQSLAEEHLVRKIRQWRPDLVITKRAGETGSEPLTQLTLRLVLSAVEQAADPGAFPDQTAVAALAPWQVKRVFATTPNDGHRSVNLPTSQFAPRLRKSLAEYASHGGGLARDRYQPAPDNIALQLLLDRGRNFRGRTNVFSGIKVTPGSDARRPQSPPTSDMALLTRAARKRRTLDQLLSHNIRAARDSSAWLAQLGDMTNGLSATSAGQVLYQLAARYQQDGQPALATEVFQLLAQRYPTHPLTEPSLIWLVEYHASEEVTWQQKQKADLAVEGRGESGEPAPVIAQASHASEIFEQRGDRPRLPANNVVRVAPKQTPAARSKQAIQIGQRAQATINALFAEPRLRFPLAAAWRSAGSPREAHGIYQTIAGTSGDAAWRTCAQTELWLEQRRGSPPRPMLLAAHSPRQPWLDGNLSDDLWQAIEPIRLEHCQTAQQPTWCWLANDGQFLYVALRCQKHDDVTYETTDMPRQRDADLSAEDRVDLLLDINRDYSSYFRLSIDHRGWTSEACFRDASWNPSWYVAAGVEPGYWTIEAAIPLRELDPEFNRGEIWAAGIQRTIPGNGFQSAGVPAAIQPLPRGFRLLHLP